MRAGRGDDRIKAADEGARYAIRGGPDDDVVVYLGERDRRDVLRDVERVEVRD